MTKEEIMAKIKELPEDTVQDLACLGYMQVLKLTKKISEVLKSWT